MKFRILTALLLFITVLHAQDKLEQEVKDSFWGTNDKYKNANEIPDKWQGESAVVIYKNINYNYHKFGKKVTYKSSYRKRIKLLDKNAVDEFSEFSFIKNFRSKKGLSFSNRNNKGKVFFAIKVIKPDGKEIEVDVDKEAVNEEGDFKLAISNLAVNDIIDFYYYTFEPFVSRDEYTFDAVERTLSDVYPIMDFKLTLESEDDFFINFRSLNGAPELKEIPTDKKHFRKYELLETNISKSEFPRWFYPLVEVPSIKFQVYFARSGKFEDRTIAFLSNDESIIKSKVSKDEILDLYDRRFRPLGRLGDVIKYFKTQDFKTDEEKVTAAYYFMRHYYLTRFYEAFVVNDAKIMSSPFELYGNFPVFIKNEKQFINHFMAFLKDYKIGYEISIGTKRYNGTIDDLLIEENIDILLKIKTKTPMYVQFFNPHTNVNQIQPLLHGTGAYLLTSNEKHRIEGIHKDMLPKSDYTKNVSSKDINLELNDGLSGFSVKTYNKMSGYSKLSEQFDRLYFYDFVYEDYAKYKTKKLTELIRKKKLKGKVTNELNAVITKLKTKQTKKLKEGVEGEFGVTKVENFEHELINTGRYGLDAELEYNEFFTFENQFIKKAGQNYIIEIGKFIGGQIEIVDKERERNVGIYMKYPRTFDYHIRLKIPNGYTVVGLDKLNKNIDNETGAFISTAKIDGEFLDIQTSKQYKHNFEPKENWSKMLAFLDEANQYTNEKILLKKVK
jgi:hypothetical protein